MTAVTATNPLAHPQLIKDLSVVKKYTDTGTISKISRTTTFVVQNPGITLRIGIPALGGALLGAGIGAGVVGGITALIAPPLAPGAAKLGGLIGAVCGGLEMVRREVIDIQKSGVYDAWKAKAINDQVFPIFQKYLQDHLTAEFVCPYTATAILRPVKDCHGHVFEHSEIMKDFALQKSPTIKCIHNMKPIEIGELEFDLEYHGRLLSALKPAFDAAVQNAAVVSGALALRENILEERASMMQATTKELFKQYADCKTADEAGEVEKQLLHRVREIRQTFSIASSAVSIASS